MRKLKIKPKRIILYVFLLAFLIIACGPFYMVWTTAFKTKADLAQSVFAFPTVIHLENIARAWEQGHFNTYYLNSILVVFPVVFVSIALSITNSYAFAYFKLPFKELFFGIIVFGMTIPMEVVIIQLYYHLQGLGLLNTLPGLILPQIAMSIPFGTFFMRATLKEISKSLIEAAEIDGAGTFAILTRVIAPLLSPSIVTLVVFFFIWTWNEFLLALVVINKESLRTLPVGMAFFSGKYTGDIPLIAMGATLMTLPIIIIYILVQRYVISGITAGAVKE